jgi:hypothetical protein
MKQTHSLKRSIKLENLWQDWPKQKTACITDTRNIAEMITSRSCGYEDNKGVLHTQLFVCELNNLDNTNYFLIKHNWLCHSI